MPIYEYYCCKCKNTDELVLPLEKRDESPTCSCGNSMQRIMSLPQKPKIFISTKEKTLESLNSPGCTVLPQHRREMAYGWDYNKTIF